MYQDQNACWMNRVISVDYNITDSIRPPPTERVENTKYRINLTLDDKGKIQDVKQENVQLYDFVCVVASSEDDIRIAAELPVDLILIQSFFQITHKTASAAVQNGATFEINIDLVSADLFHIINHLSFVSRRRNICFTSPRNNDVEIRVFAKQFGQISAQHVVDAWRRVWRNSLSRVAKTTEELQWEEAKLV